MEHNIKQNNTQAEMTKQSKVNTLIIPISIVLGFGLIAVAIFFSGGISSKYTAESDNPAEISSIRPVDETDHIKGNPNAPIIIVEYSDFDCPYCKKHHETMTRIMAEYGPSGKVAWVYRHFPIAQRHPNAVGIALASECVADLGDDDAFWEFASFVFVERELNELTNMTKLSSFAIRAGVDEAEFNACVAEERFIDKVNADAADAQRAGAQGTPHSLVLVGDQQGVISGAQPYETIKQIIDTLIHQIETDVI